MVISVEKNRELFYYFSQKVFHEIFLTDSKTDNIDSVCKVAVHSALSPVLREEFKYFFNANEEVVVEKLNELLNKNDFVTNIILHCLGDLVNIDDIKFNILKAVDRLNYNASHNEILKNICLIYAATKIENLDLLTHEKMFNYVISEKVHHVFIEDARVYIHEYFGLDLVGYRILQYKDKPLRKWIYYLSALAVKDNQGLEFFENQFHEDLHRPSKDVNQKIFLQNVFDFFHSKNTKSD